MRDHQATFPVTAMRRVLSVSPSGFYAWRKRRPSERARRDALLTLQVRESHTRSDGTYGSPRILDDLIEAGERIGRKRVARLMRSAGIAGVSRWRGVSTTRRERGADLASDLVKRDFTASSTNELWVADITYVPTGLVFSICRWCLTPIVAASWAGPWRRISGPSSCLTLSTWRSSNERPSAVIHHSDHGCQYTSLAFGQRCGEMRVRPSMGAPSAMPTTTPWGRASSPLSNASSSTVAASVPRPRHASPYSVSSKAGITRTGGTLRSATGPRSTTSAEHQRRLDSQTADRPLKRGNSTWSDHQLVGAATITQLPWDSRMLGQTAARIDYLTAEQRIYPLLISFLVQRAREAGVSYLTSRIDARETLVVNALETEGVSFYRFDTHILSRRLIR